MLYLVINCLCVLTIVGPSLSTVRALEKARATGQFNADATAALLTSADSLLGSSTTGDGLLENNLKQEPVSPPESLGLNSENNNGESTPDDEYGIQVKRRKRDV